MEKKITISNAHSSNHPTQKIELKLEGGSPYFTYVWINDIIHTIFISGKNGSLKIKKTKSGG